jgi:hypothetical protein
MSERMVCAVCGVQVARTKGGGWQHNPGRAGVRSCAFLTPITEGEMFRREREARAGVPVAEEET